jgi:hypothetical protein
MFDILKKSKDEGREILINWYYEVDDPDVQEEVEDFEIETGLQINMQPIN